MNKTTTTTKPTSPLHLVPIFFLAKASLDKAPRHNTTSEREEGSGK